MFFQSVAAAYRLRSDAVVSSCFYRCTTAIAFVRHAHRTGVVEKRHGALVFQYASKMAPFPTGFVASPMQRCKHWCWMSVLYPDSAWWLAVLSMALSVRERFSDAAGGFVQLFWGLLLAVVSGMVFQQQNIGFCAVPSLGCHCPSSALFFRNTAPCWILSPLIVVCLVLQNSMVGAFQKLVTPSEFLRSFTTFAYSLRHWWMLPGEFFLISDWLL